MEAEASIRTLRLRLEDSITFHPNYPLLSETSHLSTSTKALPCGAPLGTRMPNISRNARRHNEALPSGAPSGTGTDTHAGWGVGIAYYPTLGLAFRTIDYDGSGRVPVLSEAGLSQFRTLLRPAPWTHKFHEYKRSNRVHVTHAHSLEHACFCNERYCIYHQSC